MLSIKPLRPQDWPKATYALHKLSKVPRLPPGHGAPPHILVVYTNHKNGKLGMVYYFFTNKHYSD